MNDKIITTPEKRPSLIPSFSVSKRIALARSSVEELVNNREQAYCLLYYCVLYATYIRMVTYEMVKPFISYATYVSVLTRY